MVADQRRYPRTAGVERAALQLGRTSFPVTIDSLSPEGLGFTADRTLSDQLASGARVNVHLLDQQLLLPATVAWLSRADPARPRGGLHIELALAAASQRQHYAQWVVGLLRRRPRP